MLFGRRRVSEKQGMQAGPRQQPASSLTRSEIFRVWWPLAASWALMALEMPAVSALLARLPNPEVNLAAWGGLVFPIAILIEGPVLMLLGTSTALARDWASYAKLRRFTVWLCAGLTALHALIVFTPLYFVVAERIVKAPPEIVGPGRYGLMIMLPFAWAVGYRRLSQGLLIRGGKAVAVGAGTVVRLSTQVSLLVLGYFIGSSLGVVMAAIAVIGGVLAESAYAGVRARSCRTELRGLPSLAVPLRYSGLLRFFVPLALTTLIGLGANSVVSAGMSRMPLALESLAAWPVITGVTFLLRSLGVAYNEVVVALIERPHSYVPLRRFAVGLAWVTSAGLLVFMIPPVGDFWLQNLGGLTPELADLIQRAIWFAVPLPALAVFVSWFQGLVLHSRRTRCVTEAMILFLGVLAAALWAGVFHGGVTGLYVGMGAMTLAEFARTGWLWWRSGRAKAQAIEEAG